MVITALTRNQVARKGSWVRIPPAPPAQKFPPPFRFRLRRKLHSGGNFFAFHRDSLRWTRGGRGTAKPGGRRIDFGRLLQKHPVKLVLTSQGVLFRKGAAYMPPAKRAIDAIIGGLFPRGRPLPPTGDSGREKGKERGGFVACSS